MLLVGQQHGDEPAGSEALLVIAQELAQGRLAPLLDRINVVVFPRANPDGAEANRRSTANGIDANRDHLLLKTPEAQAMALLMREYAPVVTVDAHEYTVVGRYLEKFGTVQRFDALLQYATTANVPEFVTKAAEEWFRRPAVDEAARCRPDLRVVLHDDDRHRRQEDLDGRHAARHRAQRERPAPTRSAS